MTDIRQNEILEKINAMEDSGQSESVIEKWVDNQPDADEIYSLYNDIVQGWAQPEETTNA